MSLPNLLLICLVGRGVNWRGDRGRRVATHGMNSKPNLGRRYVPRPRRSNAQGYEVTTRVATTVTHVCDNIGSNAVIIRPILSGILSLDCGDDGRDSCDMSLTRNVTLIRTRTTRAKRPGACGLR